MKTFDAYILCTSPRSGSTLLCTLLRGSGAGCPDSHFHEPSLDAWLVYHDLRKADFSGREAALKAVFRSACVEGKGDSDIFGLRMQGHSFPFFREQLAALHPSASGDLARIEAAFGRTLLIHLTRENKLDQAISYVKAQQSGLWHRAADGAELERLSEPKEPFYDADAIAAQLVIFRDMDAAWSQWFASEAINPVRVTYDALATAPYAVLQRILEALGVAGHCDDQQTPPVAKLADEVNLEWARRFRAERKP